MSVDLTYYRRNREMKLNRAKDYYENDQERLKKQARDKYRNLSGEEKKRWGIAITICLMKIKKKHK